MGSRSDLHCWEIMQCDKSKNCPARKNPAKPCWENVAAADVDDYRSFFHVCRDCIVRVLKTGDGVLSNREIENIVNAKTGCRSSCRQKRQPLPGKNVIPLHPR